MPSRTVSEQTIMPHDLQPLSRTRYQLLFLVFICYAMFALNNNVMEPSIMEARNFVTAREMIEYNHWLVPTMNGELRLAKPPLPTWITAGAALLVSDIENVTALRLPAAIMGTMLVLCLFAIARILTADFWIPFWSALIAATSLYIVIMSRQGTWDIYAHSFMMGAILAILKGWQERHKGFYFCLAGVLLGLSFMSKGPVAFYAQLLPFSVSYAYGYGVGTYKASWKLILLALLICVAISASWPLYIQWYEAEALTSTAAREMQSWMSKRTRPFWHYWSFPIQSGMWVFCATASLIVPYAKKRLEPLGNYKFLVSWVLIAVVVLSLIPQKKERYLMPVLVPMALLTGHYIRYLVIAFHQGCQNRYETLVVYVNACLLALICFAIPIATYILVSSISNFQLILITLVFVVLGVRLLVYAFHQEVATFFITSSFLIAAVCGLILPVVLPALPAHPNYTNVKTLRTITALQGLNFYALDGAHIEHVWSLGQRIEPLPLRHGMLNLPSRRPAVLITKHRLDAPLWADKSVQLTLFDVYYYHRTKSEKRYFVYLLSAPSTN